MALVLFDLDGTLLRSGGAGVRAMTRAGRQPDGPALVRHLDGSDQAKERLEVIPGSVPDLIDMPAGCRFAPRCKARLEHELTICTDREPDLLPILSNHLVRCWLYQSAEGHRAPLRAV